jgi:hypothetical protein
VSRVGLGFRLTTQNLGFLRKVRCEPLIIGLDFDGCSSVVSPWCPCASILRRFGDVESVGLFRLTQNLGFS